MQHRFSTSSTSPIDRRLLHFIHLYLSIYFLSWVDKCVISKHKFGFIYFIYSDYCGSRLARIDEKVCVAVWCVHCKKGRKLKASIVSTTSVFFFVRYTRRKSKIRGVKVKLVIICCWPDRSSSAHTTDREWKIIKKWGQSELPSSRKWLAHGELCGRFF